MCQRSCDCVPRAHRLRRWIFEGFFVECSIELCSFERICYDDLSWL